MLAVLATLFLVPEARAWVQSVFQIGSVEIQSGGKKAFFWADLMPTTAHVKPAWTMSYDLFPHDIIHIENAGGDIDRILDQRVTVGCFPWRFMGGEAAFCRFVAFV